MTTTPTPDIGPEPDSLQSRNVRAQEEQAIQAKRQADAAAAQATAVAVHANAFAAMVGVSGNAEYDRFERMLIAVIRSPRDFGAADNSLPGMVELAKSLASLAAAEQSRMTPNPAYVPPP